ncbi:MAG: glycoside hydrolase family 97 protein [Gammaproteobacteria bacterium]|nr:glycoside hydrolase family 97 protein [Gammaproteobacteria bacterium]
MDAINAFSDIISFTYEPRGFDYSIADPDGVAGDLGAIVTRYPGRELAIQSLSFPSAPITGSSETRQSQFVAALFSFWDDHADVLSYVSLYRLFDRSDAQTTAELASQLNVIEPGDEATADGYFRSVGIRNFALGSGSKSAYHTLRNHLFARGWDALVKPTSRPFYLGQTSFAHDQTPDQPLDDAVLDELYAVIASDADMVAHHFDLGVPWNDALLDDFNSPTPPYSADVLDVWSKHRSRQPAGHKVTVSVNPLGIPRDRLAAYWGFGEGAYLDDNENIVGTGVFADFNDRLLSPPFDALSFDAPAVKTAYLAYLKRVIDFFDPDYLMTGIEVNLLADLEDSTALDAYIELQQFVYTALKADPAYAAVPIGVSFTAEQFLRDELGVPMLIKGIEQPGLEAAHVAAFQALEPYVDIIGLSIYPVKTRFSADQIPVYLFDQLFERLGNLSDKPFAITETGFPSESFTIGPTKVNGTPEQQARYLELLFAAASDFGRVEFITQFMPRDITSYMDRLRQRAAAQPPLENAGLVGFFKLFEFIGLYDADGIAKAASVIFNDAAALEFVGFVSGTTEISAASPDGQLAIQLGVDASNQLYWSAERNGVSVIEPSSLGITIDGIDLGTDVIAVSETAPLETNEMFATRGAHSVGSNHYLMSIVTVERTGPGDESFAIELRVFDDGLAYRYLIPGSGTRTVSGEASSWQFPVNNRIWFNNKTSNYEAEYYTGQMGLVSDDIGFPVTVEVPDAGVYVTLSDADIGDYSGMSVRAEFVDRALRAQFLDDAQWPVEGRTSSPWRFSVIAPDLDTLVNTDMLARLNPAPDATLFPGGLNSVWIRPGKALWSWWSAPYSGADYNIQQNFVDEAHAMGLEYVVIDAWWEAGFPANDQDQFQRLGELVSYAHSDGRNVDLWVWKNFFELIDPVERQSFFDVVRNAGAVGVKVDSIYGLGSDMAIAATLRQAILRDAADRELMLNFHGMSKPSGLSRTYPNLVAQEGFAGLEGSGLAWELGFFITAAHNATLPFTRFVLGPGDYTPVTFDERKIGGTTFVHQLATAGVFSSPVMHYADHPSVLQQVTEAQDLLQEMPTEWEETRTLPGSQIGELVVMARRDGNTWWLFVLSGDESAGNSIAVDLSFLGSGTYEMVTIADLTPTSVTRNEGSTANSSSTLNIDLLPGGGFVGRFR